MRHRRVIRLDIESRLRVWSLIAGCRQRANFAAFPFTVASLLTCSACTESSDREPSPEYVVEHEPAVYPAQASVLREWILSPDSLAGITSVAINTESGVLAALDVRLGLVALFEARDGELLRYFGGQGEAPGNLSCGSAVNSFVALRSDGPLVGSDV